MPYKSKLIVVVLGLLTLFSCSSSEKDVLIFKGHNIKCRIPNGWTLKQIDSTKDGGFSILQQETSELFKPTICIWTNDYAESLSKSLNIKPEPFMLQMSVTAASNSTESAKFTQKYDMNMGEVLNKKNKTKNFFVTFNSENSDAVVSVLAGDKNSNEITAFRISVVTTPPRLDKIITIADELSTSIIKQLNHQDRD